MAKKKNKKGAKKAKKATRSAQARTMMAAAPMAAMSSESPAVTAIKSDADIVREGYEDSMKESVKGYIQNCIDVGIETAEERFLNILTINRNALVRLTQLVK
jgi:uncharacterized iron-regulated protein